MENREILFDVELNKLKPKKRKKSDEEMSGSFIDDEGKIVENIGNAENKEKLQNNTESILFKELDDKPFALIQEVGRLMRELKFREIPALIKNCASISELRRDVLKIMKDAIEEKPEGFVADLEKIKNYKYHFLIKRLKSNFHNTKLSQKSYKNSAQFYNNSQKNTVLFYAFKDFPVISKEDYHKGIYDKKELFYFPNSPEQALSPDEVKKHPDFHLDTWEMGKCERGEQMPTKTGEKVDLRASRLACLIYHPHFGNGQRDKNGDLLVTYPNGQRKKIDLFFLHGYGLKKGEKDSDELNLTSSPYKYLKSKKGEVITNHNILKPEDFSLSLKSAEFSHRLINIASNGYAMINSAPGLSIRYYVGRNFESNPNFKAIKINDEFGGVIELDEDKNKKLVSIFNLTNYDDGRLNIGKNSKGSLIKTANIKISRVKAITEVLPSASLQEKEIFINFDKFLTVVNGIKKTSGADILPLIETEESWHNITNAFATSNKSSQEIGDFVKKYGINNLQWFLGSEVKIEEFDKYISLGQNLKHETAKKIFDKYGEIVELAQTNIAELNDNFFADGGKEIDPLKELIARGKKIVMTYAEKLADVMTNNKDGLYIELLRDLDDIKKEIVLFTSMFKTAFDEYGGIDFRDIKGLAFETNKSSGLTDDEKNQILTLSDNIYAEKSNVSQLLRDGLRQAFNNSEKTKWYLLKKNNKIIATMRFDETNKPNTVYAGSFMVEKEYGGSAIGKAMEKIIFEEETKNNQDLVAVTEADGLPISHYVEKQGWIVTGIEIKKEIPFFNILKSTKNDKGYLSRQNDFLPEKVLTLVQKTKTTKEGEDSDIFAREYSKIPSGSEHSEIQNILKQGYAITRFLRGNQYGDKAYLVFEKIKEKNNT